MFTGRKILTFDAIKLWCVVDVIETGVI